MNREYWNKRTNQHNHTGWADEVIYCFDQPARIKTVSEILNKHDLAGDTALDFGCGTGDITRILASRFKEVIGYDISNAVVQKAQSLSKGYSSVHYFSSMADMKISDHSLDLVTCITVLDHLIDDTMLNETIQYFRRKLKSGGYLLALEYAPSAVAETSFYQRFDTFSTWVSRFQKSGFALKCSYGYFHPFVSPVNSYLKYKSDFRVKLWTALKRFPASKKNLAALGTKYAGKEKCFFWPGKDDDYLKIMLFKTVQ